MIRSKNKELGKKDKVLIQIQILLLKLVIDNYPIEEFGGPKRSTLYKLRHGERRSDTSYKKLFSAILPAYEKYCYKSDIKNFTKMNKLLLEFNEKLKALGVVSLSKRKEYIEYDDNFCEKIISFCEKLLNNDDLNAPYWLYYRSENETKLKFPLHLSPSLIEERLTVGREKEYLDIDQMLEESKYTVYLFGIPGIGKSIVAQVYASKITDRTTAFINIPAESKDVCSIVLSELDSSQLENLSVNEESKDNIIKGHLYNYAEGMKSYEDNGLLIIDGVSSMEQLHSVKNLKPLNDIGWKILVTTRVVNDEIKNNGLYEIEPLSLEKSIKLFRHHYLKKDKNAIFSEKEHTDLEIILKEIACHTYLIVLLAEVGHRSNSSIKRLKDIVIKSDNDISWSNEFLAATLFDVNKKQFVKIGSIILDLIVLDNLDDLKKKILCYFVLLPDTPIKKKDLVSWISDNDQLKPILLELKLVELYEEGWLLLEDEKEQSYKCHCIVQNAVSMDEAILSTVDFTGFIKNIASYLNFPDDGTEQTDVFKNLVILSSVIAKYRDDTVQRYELLKQYLLCCIYFNNYTNSPDEYTEKLEELEELRKKFYPKDSPNYQVEKVICQKIHNNIFLNVYNKHGKIPDILDLLKSTLSETESVCDKEPLLHIRAKQEYANLLSRTGNFEVALQLLDESEKQLIQTLEQTCIEKKKEWQYALFNNYNLKGLLYNRKSRLLSKFNGLYEALDMNLEYLKIGEELLTDNPYKLRSCHNDLGMTYLYLYDETRDESFLKKAKVHLKRSYKSAIDRYGKNSIRSITAIKNFASYLERKQSFAGSKAYAKYSYQLIINQPNSINSRERMITARLLGKIHLKEFRHKKIKDRILLVTSLEYLNESLEISNFLYGVERNIDSDRNLELIAQVNKELAKLNN